MQSQILTTHPQARLRVYAIWVNKQVGDARSRWDAAGLTDPRVVHLWDAKDVSGVWLVANVPGYQCSDWDSYLLFGPEATWTSHPTPPAQLRRPGLRPDPGAQPSHHPAAHPTR